MAGLASCVFFLSLFQVGVFGNIVLTNNAYTGLQIVISSSVSEDLTLITRLQEIFTDASSYLFTATKYRAYFGSIDIVIPESWTSMTPDARTASVDTSSPYINVDLPNPMFGDNPYVRLNLECGKPGWYMHLTPGFIDASNADYGDHDASSYLFTATKYRAYFGSIDIVIPESWTSMTPDARTASVDTSSPYINVDLPNPMFGDNPYVRLNLECGKPGWYMHLTPGFIDASNADYGDHGKVIVHEWGHLWWGLFDEYPSISDRYNGGMKQFYQKDGRYHPVMCSRETQGTIEFDLNASGTCSLTNPTMDHSCRFVPSTNQSTRASIMSYQWIDSIIEFCDTDDESIDADLRHNTDAPNRHNALCDGKSAWEVMREHEDFRDDNNPPTLSSTDTTPTFRILRKSAKIRVLVFDVSGSMGWSSSLGTLKINEQAQAAEFVINNIVETGSYLALVSFSSFATTLARLTVIDSQQTKDTLIAAVPRNAGGSTYIDLGLLQAIAIITNNTYVPTEGSEIVLLSDGAASRDYLHKLPDLLNHGIIVHTIAITNAADADMSEMASQTGGKSFTYLSTTTVSFADVMRQAIQADDAGEAPVQQLRGTVYTISSVSSISGYFIVDEGLGIDTTITVLLASSQQVTIEVIGPQGIFDPYNEIGDIVTLQLTSGAQVEKGNYTYVISLLTSYSGTVEIQVSSSPSSADAEVIRVSTRLSNSTIDLTDAANPPKVYIAVHKKYKSVLNADVTLSLTATSSNNVETIIAHDNGAGADTEADDGIYSAYILPRYIIENSNYNIKVSVKNTESTYTYNSGVSSRASSLPGTEEPELITETIDSFERSSVTEEVVVVNYQTNPVDTTPPAKITDFVSDLVAIEAIDGILHVTYTFSWTAVGADLDVGQSTAYEMRYHYSNSSFVRNNFPLADEVPATLSTPLTSGTIESFNITFTQDHCNGTCYVGIRAMDENNLNGSVSNIVTIDIDFTYTINNTNQANITDNTQNEENEDTNILLITLLVVVPVVVLFGLIVVAIVVYKNHSNKNKTACSSAVSSIKIDHEASMTGINADDIKREFIGLRTRDPFRAARTMFVNLPLKDDNGDKIFPVDHKTQIEELTEDKEMIDDLPPAYHTVVLTKESETHKASNNSVKDNERDNEMTIEDVSDEETHVPERMDVCSVKSGKGLWLPENNSEISINTFACKDNGMIVVDDGKERSISQTPNQMVETQSSKFSNTNPEMASVLNKEDYQDLRDETEQKSTRAKDESVQPKEENHGESVVNKAGQIDSETPQIEQEGENLTTPNDFPKDPPESHEMVDTEANVNDSKPDLVAHAGTVNVGNLLPMDSNHKQNVDDQTDTEKGLNHPDSGDVLMKVNTVVEEPAEGQNDLPELTFEQDTLSPDSAKSEVKEKIMNTNNLIQVRPKPPEKTEVLVFEEDDNDEDFI